MTIDIGQIFTVTSKNSPVRSKTQLTVQLKFCVKYFSLICLIIFFTIRMYVQRTLVVLMLIYVMLLPVQAWWPFSSSSSEETGTEQGKHLENSPVPFEMTTAEEKFLAEAKKYMGDLTPLDSCHQIVSLAPSPLPPHPLPRGCSQARL